MRRGETTRERILTAAATVIGEHGLARTTTKEIARLAGYSEATLYKHFPGKEDLVLEVIRIRLAPFIALIVRLPEQAGTRSVRAHLEQVAQQMLGVFADSGPLAMALFAEPALLERQRAAFAKLGGGPHKANALLAEYLRREQALGRIAPAANPQAAADLLIGACFQRAFLVAFVGREALDRNEKRFVKELVAAVVRGL